MNQNSKKFGRFAMASWLVGAVLVAGVYAGSVRFARWEKSIAPPPAEPFVSRSRPGDDENNVLPNAFIACDVYLPNIGHGVSAETMDMKHVHLYQATPTGEVEIIGTVNTSGGGDSIIFQPTDMLATGSKFRFVCDGVRDTSGQLFKHYEMSFKTAPDSVMSSYPVAFDHIQLPETIGNTFTGLTVGPDHRLYAGTADGRIMRYDFQADGTLSPATIINTVLANNKASDNPAGNRLITGICFDPRSTPGHLIAWVNHGFFGVENCPDWSCKMSRLEGANLESYQDVITGLPRAYRDHLSFKMVFGPDGGLYFNQGSSSSTGGTDKNWGLRPEHLLTAACLRVDTKAIEARLAAGQKALFVKTEDDGHYDPFAPGAPLTFYATGVRCGFSLLWHSNGKLYSCLNGGAAGGGSPGTPEDLSEIPKRNDEGKFGKYNGGVVPSIADVEETQPDLFVCIEKGAYYGHPNFTRGEYVLFGGNPDNKTGNYQVHDYPPNTKPDRNWHPALWNIGISLSANGLIEYKSDVFGDALKGKILVTRYSGGKDIEVFSLTPDGKVAETISGITGFTQFNNPLDLAEDPATGNLYVSEYGGQKLTLLKPKPTKVSRVIEDKLDHPPGT